MLAVQIMHKSFFFVELIQSYYLRNALHILAPSIKNHFVGYYFIFNKKGFFGYVLSF